jgi:hypothetical protein
MVPRRGGVPQNPASNGSNLLCTIFFGAQDLRVRLVQHAHLVAIWQRQADEERQRRIQAERAASVLKAMNTKLRQKLRTDPGSGTTFGCRGQGWFVFVNWASRTHSWAGVGRWSAR